MEPTLKNGNEVIVSSLPYLFRNPKAGDIIAFSFARRDLVNLHIVKRVSKVSGHRLQVTGDNKKDSKDFGWIEREDIIGKVIYIYA